MSDIRRIPEWSPDCTSAEWTGPGQFRGRNRRGIGRWSTTARVVADCPGREFGFIVQLGKSDFTRWIYRMEPDPDGCVLTEEMQMCIDLPPAALLFERVALRVSDRRADLRGNIDHSLQRIRRIVEGAAFAPHPGIG